MSNSNLRKTVALGSVAVLLLVDFSLFHDFFYPFRFLWNQGKLFEFFLSLALFFWSLLGAFLIFFSARSLFRTITLPLFLFFFIFNIGTFNIANSPIDFQQADLIVSYYQWWFWAVVENFGLAALPGFIILIPSIIVVERWKTLALCVVDHRLVN